MASVVMKGKAVVEGIPGTLDVIAGVLNQSATIAQAFDEEILKDEHGFDAVWMARNEHVTVDLNVKLTGTTKAAAKAVGVFLTPYSTVVLSGFDLSFLNASWQYTGGTIDLANDRGGGFNIKLRKYADLTQSTSAITTAT